MQMIEQYVRSTVNSFNPMFEETLSLLPERQKEVIYAIAKEGKAKEVTSSFFVRKHTLKPSSTVQPILRQLLEKEFITRENDVYIVYDRFLDYGLRRNLALDTLFNPSNYAPKVFSILHRITTARRTFSLPYPGTIWVLPISLRR